MYLLLVHHLLCDLLEQHHRLILGMVPTEAVMQILHWDQYHVMAYIVRGRYPPIAALALVLVSSVMWLWLLLTLLMVLLSLLGLLIAL